MSIRSIAVIGAGPAGRAFARRCAESGFRVTLEDVMPSNLRRAKDELADCGDVVSSGSLRFAGTVEDAVREADLAVDFVPDELESKLEIVSLLDRMAPPHTILCTPTLTLSITDLASCTYRPERVLGLRAAGGSLLTGDLAIIRGRFTDDASVESLREVVQRLGLRAEVVADEAEPALTRNIPPSGVVKLD